jgi:hypothetical protein
MTNEVWFVQIVWHGGGIHIPSRSTATPSMHAREPKSTSTENISHSYAKPDLRRRGETEAAIALKNATDSIDDGNKDARRHAMQQADT